MVTVALVSCGVTLVFRTIVALLTGVMDVVEFAALKTVAKTLVVEVDAPLPEPHVMLPPVPNLTTQTL